MSRFVSHWVDMMLLEFGGTNDTPGQEDGMSSRRRGLLQPSGIGGNAEKEGI